MKKTKKKQKIHAIGCEGMIMQLCSGIGPRLKPVVLGEPPHNHGEDDDEDHCKENNEAPDQGAFSFLSLTKKP